MKKMVIHCASGIKNNGDEAILDALIQRFREEYHIVVISLNKQYSQKIHPNVVFLSYSDRNTCKSHIAQCDMFILGGGGLLQDTTTIYNVSRWLYYLKYACKCGKYTYVYANSIGPLHYGINRRSVKRVLKKVTRITVRDRYSQELLERMDIPCTLTADPVFGLRYSLNGMEEKYRELPDKYVAIAIRHWFDTVPLIPVSLCTKLKIRNQRKYNHYIEQMRECVAYINDRKKMPVVFLSFCYERDAGVARDILCTDRLQDINQIINEELAKPEDLLYIISNAELLIGMRLHSIIYALRTSCPFVPIIYESKVQSLVNMLDCNELAVFVEKLLAKDLNHKIERVLREKERLLENNSRKLSHLIQMEKKNSIGSMQ
ncbi:MAG: polysaccharide pyruvyl transferase family protein [Roseburia sp.]|nr:polysaccharide pyruvyl transferase family protein [Roseburia sp.]